MKNKFTKENNYIAEYVSHDTEFTVNDNDPDLQPITLSLPSPPKLSLIDNYGLPKKEQKFRHVEYPVRLKRLEERVTKELAQKMDNNRAETFTPQKVINMLWDELDKQKDKYEEEINWIRKQIYHIINGYWVYINGKPTYHDGWHYFFLNFWSIPGEKFIQYRDRDRRWFLFARYVYTTMEDDKGESTGFRTFYGFLYPKHRRDGATHKALCIGYCILMYHRGGHFGIQSFDEDNAKEHYTSKLLPAFDNMPFFVKPMWRGNKTPLGALNFESHGNEALYTPLNSKITYATTAARKAYDGKPQIYHLCEETGKTILENVYERWLVVKETLGRGKGSVIKGFTIFPTTVADMEAGGGREFKDLSDKSNFYDRVGGTNMTESGLCRLFIPAYDGLEGFVGEFGESIIETPTPEQVAFIRKEIGAKEHIESSLNQLLKKGDPASMTAYREEIRLYPTKYSDCFDITAGNIGFPIEDMRRRMHEINRKEKETVTGNFKWLVNDIPHTSRQIIEKNLKINSLVGRIIFEPDREGRWEVSDVKRGAELGKANQRFVNNNVWFPINPKYTLGADPFTFKTEKSVKYRSRGLSNGGGVIVRDRDLLIDPEGKDIKDWETWSVVADYSYRADSDDEYVLDMLMPAIYYGAMVFPENNIKIVLKNFILWGYKGYLKHEVDEVTGKLKEEAGGFTGTRTKEELFMEIQRYFSYRCHREKHYKILEEGVNIESAEHMKFYDRLAALGYALWGSKSPYGKHLQSNNSNGFDATRAWKRRKY